MIAFLLKLNGKHVCVAGADDLAVLSTHINAVGKLGEKTVPLCADDTYGLRYSVGGLTSRKDSAKDVHLRWQAADLNVGDVLEVTIVDVEKVDKPKSRKRATRKQP